MSFVFKIDQFSSMVGEIVSFNHKYIKLIKFDYK